MWPFPRSKPKYDVSRQDLRRLTHFSIFAFNMAASEWLQAQYPAELVTELSLVEKRLTDLYVRHCMNHLWYPYRLNLILDKFHLPNISFRKETPVDVVGYVNSALDQLKNFCETWNVFESPYFWPEKCPKDSVPFDNPRISHADEIYDYYERAINQ